jgi:mRNA interferase RelE/StbE
MASYRLVWRSAAEKELRSLPRNAIARLVALAAGLRQNPVPRESRKSVNADHTYRIRSGDYRLIYTVERNRLVVEVVRFSNEQVLNETERVLAALLHELRQIETATEG